VRVIVIGLDGAAFELIEPWIREGELPTIKKLISKGCSANLESCLPPVTSPNWKCYSTGKNPGKLGIFWWENIDLKNRRITFPYSRINKSKEIWDYLSESGKKVGIINMPLTYPPKKVNGFMISDGFGKNRNFTYPKELENKLKKRYNYKIHPELLPFIEERSEEAVKEILEIISMRFTVAKELLNEYDLDFLHLTIFHINTLHHYFWNGKFTKQAWKLIDRNIRYFVKEDCDLFIMSDHGSNPIKQVFYINSWLAKEGYLKFNRKVELCNLLYQLGITKQHLAKIAKRLRIEPLLRRFISMEKLGFLPSEAGTIDMSGKTDLIDWNRTLAIASGQGPVYINLNSKDKEKIREELIIKLESLRNPLTGEKIAKKVYRKEEIYSGEFLSEAPDLIIDQSSGTHIRGGIDVSKKRIFEEPKKWMAENKRYGIFIAHGLDIKRGVRLEKVSILDLAPTILHMMNVPIPSDMDGRVLVEIFESNSEPAKREVRYQDKTQIERDRIRRAIKKLRG